MFRAPSGSSSPLPSTPPKGGQLADSLFGGTNPSTTPAGPPPASFTHLSTTPAGQPPPSSNFGSATFGSGNIFQANSSFGQNNVFNHSPSRHQDHGFRGGDFDDLMQDDEDIMGDGLAMQRKPPLEKPDYLAAARSFANVPPQLQEPDDLVLNTEDILENLFTVIKEDMGHRDIEHYVVAAVNSLSSLWDSKSPASPVYSGIGPGDKADPITKISWLGSLLMKLHHPGPNESRNTFASLRVSGHRKPIPEVLLQWLDTHHNPFPGDFEDLINYAPNPTAHERFWDVLFSLVVRGQLSKARQILAQADFSYAYTAIDDGAEDVGYHGAQLGNVDRVIKRAAEMLDKCPASESGDWNVTGAPWSAFRNRVHHAVSDLEQFAEGNSADRDAGASQSMSANNFNMPSVRSDDFSLSTMSRRAESKVPWTIYQNLQALYGQLLGTRQEIVNSSQDWLEAVIGTAVWWDGDEGDGMHENLAASRRPGRRPQIARMVDSQPLKAYQQQLASSLRQITADDEEGDLQVNPTSAVEVALACIFEEDLEGFIGIARGWSPTIASAIVEVAGYGGWLGLMQTASDNIVDMFTDSDLHVLQYAKQSDKRLQKDDVLSHYAGLVSRRQELRAADQVREGWQLAIQILGRLDNRQLSNEHIGKLLDKLEFSEGPRVEQAISLCSKLGLGKESRKLSERYADHLLQESRNFGDAVLHYARAHNQRRLKELVNMLVSYCLVTSSAWPPTSSLDPTMSTLLSSPQAALSQLRRHDTEASHLLSFHFAGYATVRRFYDLRDQDVIPLASAAPLPRLSSSARKAAAARTLIASISSAADSINGGLVDDSVSSVLEVDGLLVLLGEALPFLTPDNSSPEHNASSNVTLSQPQILALLRAAEDISTVPSGVFAQCEACLSSTLAHAHGTEVPSPRAALKKSTSNLSGSTFSLINSGDLESKTSNGHASSVGSSGVLVSKGGAEVKRAWDWRKGFAKSARGEDVVRVLRLGLARELSRCWMGAEGGA
ncbi:hypothetical protein FH972_025218 [Carpinus fangiana]|uniref:Nuclear pore complex protein Nup85 n=1 Tax=Carpinus fangiana TaxID=176857 RepID=A0A5N6L0I5_9ROSI|nr:hypothetical protein FH972_025218 [Carpinus fangiana]